MRWSIDTDLHVVLHAIPKLVKKQPGRLTIASLDTRKKLLCQFSLTLIITAFLSGFMYFWSWVFVIATTLTAIFKHEAPVAPEEQPDGVIDTYKMLWRIIKLPAVLRYCAMLLTAKV